jgi:hypothetical protein
MKRRTDWPVAIFWASALAFDVAFWATILRWLS